MRSSEPSRGSDRLLIVEHLERLSTSHQRVLNRHHSVTLLELFVRDVDRSEVSCFFVL